MNPLQCVNRITFICFFLLFALVSSQGQNIDPYLGSIPKQPFIYLQNLHTTPLPGLNVFSDDNDGSLMMFFNKKRRAAADSLITKLKDGVLIVRLKSYSKNLTALDETLANPKLSKKDRRGFKKMRKLMVRDRDRFNGELINGLVENYDFSDFLVLYDTSIYQLQLGINSGYFLNSNLEVDSTLGLEDRPFLLIGEAPSVGEAKKGSVGLTLYDSSGKRTEYPFPCYHGVKNSIRTFLSLFNGSQYIRRDGKIIVTNFNRAFDKFHENALFRKERREAKEAEKKEKEKEKNEKEGEEEEY